FDLAGQPNGWMPLIEAMLFGPAIGALIWFLCLVRPVPPVAALATSVAIAGGQLLIVGKALGQSWDVPRYTTLLLGLTWILVGNSLGKLPRNRWAGIRTPWAMADEEVWARTQRFGGWAFILAGFATLAMMAVPLKEGRLALLMAPMAAAGGLSVLRSWQIWRELHPGAAPSRRIGRATLALLVLALLPLLAVAANRLGFLGQAWMVRLVLAAVVAIVAAAAIRKADGTD
ncbi:MAG: SdpI family protein, partial [Burkholderiaceae bacterium]|nr:SdpI family protein [Burkholderiaceae bacterium]